MSNNIVKFEVKYTDINRVLASGLVEFSGFSPLAKEEVLQKINDPNNPVSTLSEEEFDNLVQLVKPISNPYIRLELRFGGGKAPLAIQLICVGKDSIPNPMGIMFDADKVIIYKYESVRILIDALVSKYASKNEAVITNIIPPFCSLEEFMYILHSVDMYRRTLYRSMLLFEPGKQVVVPVKLYSEEMSKSIRAKDIRWLMPACAGITPNIDFSKMKVTTESFNILIDTDLVKLVQNPEDQDYGLEFTDRGKSLGVEFERSWHSSIGFEMNRLSDQGIELIERGFVAPTASSNHFATIEEREGELVVNHQAFHYNQLHARFDELFTKALT